MPGAWKADLIYAVLALFAVGLAREVFFTIVGAAADLTGFWRWYRRRAVRKAMAQLSDPEWLERYRAEVRELVKDLAAAREAKS